MIPLFFGSHQKQLFGVYYPSNRRPSLLHGVLLCPPVGQEYMRTHMALKQLSVLLSSMGFDVLKFDYYGVGDSSGESRQGHIETWIEDVRTACQELKDMSGVQSISLIGLRLGALIAARAVSNGLSPKNLLLWDPVVCGEDYIQELRDLTTELVDDDAENDEGFEVLVGFPYSVENIALIASINLLNLDFQAVTNTCLIISEAKDDYQKLYDQLKASGINIEYRNLFELSRNINPSEKKKLEVDAQSMLAKWSSQKEFEQALIAHHAISEITNLLKRSV